MASLILTLSLVGVTAVMQGGEVIFHKFIPKIRYDYYTGFLNDFLLKSRQI